VPRPVSFRCGAEPTARRAFPPAQAASRLGSCRVVAIGVGILWGLCGGMNWWLVGGRCSAAEADLTAPVTATWNGIGLRAWAERISATAGMPVLVDRRLDPDTAIRLECQGEPLLDVLTRAAAVADGELAVLESSIRIVPRGMADLIIRAEAARTAEIASLPSRQRAVLTQTQPWQWPAGARPHDLLTDAAALAGVRLEEIGTVPHDHLPAASLPEMTLAERLDLLVAPFDLRVDWRVARTATGSRATAPLTGRVIAMAAGLPSTTVTAAAGNPASPKPAARLLPSRQKAPAGAQTFSLRVAAPLVEVLAAIATRLGLQLDLDRASLTRSGIASEEIVRATVTDASRDELLHAILDPLTLDWTIDGTTLRVFSPDK
jgi:hypothetical protein